jgi:hypothetical protein
MYPPTAYQKTVLVFIAAEGGYSEKVVDCGSAEQCVNNQWLVHEGADGYALTLEGAYLARQS